MGEKVGYIDFDYRRFDLMAEAVGIPVSERSGLHIQVLEQPPTSSVEGTYDVTDKSISVLYSHRPNTVLAHELQHAADELSGRLHYSRRYRAGCLAQRLLKPVVSLAMVATVTNQITHNETVQTAFQLPSLGLILGTAAVGFWGYNFHPAERRARQAEHNSSFKVLQVD